GEADVPVIEQLAEREVGLPANVGQQEALFGGDLGSRFDRYFDWGGCHRHACLLRLASRGPLITPGPILPPAPPPCSNASTTNNTNNTNKDRKGRDDVDPCPFALSFSYSCYSCYSWLTLLPAISGSQAPRSVPPAAWCLDLPACCTRRPSSPASWP